MRFAITNPLILDSKKQFTPGDDFASRKAHSELSKLASKTGLKASKKINLPRSSDQFYGAGRANTMDLWELYSIPIRLTIINMKYNFSDW
jgi:hypothetical protein